MPALHDYLCKQCGHIEFETFEHPPVCPDCEGKNTMAIYFGSWDTVKLGNGGDALDNRTDRKGFIQRFEVRDDPLCAKELSPDRDMHGIKSFTPEQSKHYRNKLEKDGDSATLRREILEQRQKNLGTKKEAAWK